MPNELGNVGIANTLQPEAIDIAPVILGCFCQICTAHAHSFQSKLWHHS